MCKSSQSASGFRLPYRFVTGVGFYFMSDRKLRLWLWLLSIQYFYLSMTQRFYKTWLYTSILPGVFDHMHCNLYVYLCNLNGCDFLYWTNRVQAYGSWWILEFSFLIFILNTFISKLGVIDSWSFFPQKCNLFQNHKMSAFWTEPSYSSSFFQDNSAAPVFSRFITFSCFLFKLCLYSRLNATKSLPLCFCIGPVVMVWI